MQVILVGCQTECSFHPLSSSFTLFSPSPSCYPLHHHFCSAPLSSSFILFSLLHSSTLTPLHSPTFTHPPPIHRQVIYGDTDSIMIHTGLDNLAQAKEIGSKVKKEINKGHSPIFTSYSGATYTRLSLPTAHSTSLQLCTPLSFTFAFLFPSSALLLPSAVHYPPLTD